MDCGDHWQGKIEPFSKNVMHLSRIDLIDAKYPSWRKVLPRDLGPAHATILAQSQYLALFENVVKTLGIHRSYDCIRLKCCGEGQSVVARINHSDMRERFVAVVMQLRDDNPPPTVLPDWLMPEPAKSEA